MICRYAINVYAIRFFESSMLKSEYDFWYSFEILQYQLSKSMRTLSMSNGLNFWLEKRENFDYWMC